MGKKMSLLVMILSYLFFVYETYMYQRRYQASLELKF